MALGRVNERREPAAVGKRIRIERGDEIAVLEPLDSTVVGGREADVHWTRDHFDVEAQTGRCLSSDLIRAVSTRVVDEYDAIRLSGLAGNGGQAPVDVPGSVERHDTETNSQPRSHGQRRRQADDTKGDAANWRPLTA
jgi:hypothetical protein